MGLHLIIDGYNLIRQSKQLSLLDRQDIARGREALISRLTTYRRFKPHCVTVVFDGAKSSEFCPSRDTIQGIHIVFSRSGDSADTVIVRMACKERERALVVSSDAAVARASAACGAATLDSLEFEARMSMAEAMADVDAPDAKEAARRLSTRKKGEGRRLPKRLRQQRAKAAKL
jgi:uncharacterized protein